MIEIHTKKLCCKKTKKNANTKCNISELYNRNKTRTKIQTQNRLCHFKIIKTRVTIIKIGKKKIKNNLRIIFETISEIIQKKYILAESMVTTRLVATILLVAIMVIAAMWSQLDLVASCDCTWLQLSIPLSCFHELIFAVCSLYVCKKSKKNSF